MTQHIVPYRIGRLMIEGKLDPFYIAREKSFDRLLIERSTVKLTSSEVNSMQA